MVLFLEDVGAAEFSFPSPGDEAYEKLEFYAQVNVAEVWITDRDSRVPELRVLRDASYHELLATPDGWLCSPTTGVQLRPVADAKRELQLPGDKATRGQIPQAADFTSRRTSRAAPSRPGSFWGTSRGSS